jgi:hypothetical protein
VLSKAKVEVPNQERNNLPPWRTRADRPLQADLAVRECRKLVEQVEVVLLVPVQETEIQRRFCALTPFLDERMRRLVAAAESEAIDYGGVSTVARASGVAARHHRGSQGN